MKYHRHLMFLAMASAALGAFSKAYADVDENMVIAENTDADLSAESTSSYSAEYTADVTPVGPPLVYSQQNTGVPYTTPFPDFDHLPIVRPLPDTFRFFDGTRSTDFADWEERRNEIKASMETFEIGPIPEKNGHPSIPNSAVNVTVVWIPPGAAGSIGANAGKLTVTITRPSNGKVVNIVTKVWRPSGFPAGTKFAAIIPMNGGTSVSTGNTADYGNVPAAIASARAIGTVSFPHNSVTNYTGGTNTASRSADPFYAMYPELIITPQTSSTSGQYAAWSWGISRLIDGLQVAAAADPNFPIDVARLATVGCSYAGKMALMGGAFDERVALTFALESGGGGAPAWRLGNEIEGYRVTETMSHTDYQWFRSGMRRFSYDNHVKLPHDHHDLQAMVAPRALMMTGNTDFNWLTNKSGYISGKAVQRVYDAFGIGDRYGFFIDGAHGHCAVPATQNPMFIGMIDKFLLGNAAANTDWHVHPWGASLDAARWTAWWGTNDPSMPDDFTPENGTANITMEINPPLNIAAGGTVVGGYQLAMLGNHAASSLTVKGLRLQLDVVNPDGRSYVLRIPVAQVSPVTVTQVNNSVPEQTYAIPADSNAWFSSTDQAVIAPSFGGVATRARLTMVGSQASWSGTGNLGGPGIVGTAASSWNPVAMKFHIAGADSNPVIVSRGAKFLSVVSTPSLLGVPSGQMVPVTVAVNTASSFDPAPVSRIMAITANQPIVAGVDYTPAVLPTTGSLKTVSLKCVSTASPGRIYTLTIECTDKFGNKSQTTTTVTAAPLPLPRPRP